MEVKISYPFGGCNPQNRQVLLDSGLDKLVYLLLVLSIVLVFGKVVDYEFVNFDDPRYIEDNRFVRMGISSESLKWAFTDGITTTGYWAPLTLLSFLLDYQLYGMNAGGYHATNLLLHIVNSLLLYLFFRRVTGALWPSALVALLFAIHPLHVESVAWVTERKDVLSTFFWILTMLAYDRYINNPGIHSYLSVFIIFVAGMMAKPMLVTLPFVLLLLDFWPLGRYAGPNTGKRVMILRTMRKCVVEKIPFFIIALAASLVTYLFQKKIGAVAPLANISLETRVTNTLVAYTGYIQDMFWPVDLAVLYPHPGVLPMWMPVISGLILVGISALVLWKSANSPYLFTGWLWYILTLAPVSGMVVIGPHATADRYTYVPLIGLFIMIAWGGAAIMRKGVAVKIGLTAMAVITLSIFITLAHTQSRTWADSISLFENAVTVTEKNETAHLNLGHAYNASGRRDEALLHYKKALQINPGNAGVYNNIGAILLRERKYADAIYHFKIALDIDPTRSKTHNNLGNVYLKQNKYRKAVIHYREALKLNPFAEKTHNGLGVALLLLDRPAEAKYHFETALTIYPGYASAQRNLEKMLDTDINSTKPAGEGR